MGTLKRTDRQNEDGDGPCFFLFVSLLQRKQLVFSVFIQSQNHLHPMSSGILAAASHILSSESGKRVPGWRGETERRAVGEETGEGGGGVVIVHPPGS